ncbi:MAG: hypothetical protein IJK06_08445 [Clostridia bacterium]|nr:hypothetical protein [Clostridia bacterium]
MDIVNENALFETDDVFHRIDFVQKAMKLIEMHRPERGACVIDIDAPWGMGKTTLLKMWINELEKDDSPYSEFKNVSSECVYYNAWEKDYNSDALTPLIYAICGSLSAKANETDGWGEGFKEKMKAMVSAGVGIITSYLCYRGTRDEMFATGVGGMAGATTDAAFHLLEGNEPEELGKAYLADQEKREVFHKAVSDLAGACGKLFIFIDELDRCKPTFAIQTLECIKHYFNIPNVVFIFATDMSQLAHTVETYYGHGMDAGGYFLKFFDHFMHLSVPNIRELIQFSYPKATVKKDEFFSYINEIRKTFSLTPRESPWLVQRTNKIWNIAFSAHRNVDLSASYAFIAFLMAVKMKMPDRFSLWLTDQDSLSDVFSANDETFIGQCMTFLQNHLTINTYDLADEIHESNERETRRQIDGVTQKGIDYQDVFLHTTYAVCVPQTAISQTVGEALLASLELC